MQSPTDPPNLSALARLARFWPSVFLIIAVGWLYAPVRHFTLVWYDDDLFLLKNPHLRQGLDWASIQWAFTGHWRANWIPISWLSWLGQKAVFGGWSPGAMHLVGVALHGLNVLLVYRWLSLLGLPRLAVFCAAAVFATHPLNVEAVAWVTAQKDTLGLALGLGALIAWERRRWSWCVLLFLLSMLTKQSLVTIPLLLWIKTLLDCSIHDRPKSLRQWSKRGIEICRGSQGMALLALTAVALLTSAMALHSSQEATADRQAALAQPIMRRAQAAIDASWLLLKRLVWPSDLHCHYDWPLSWPDLQTLLAAIVLVGISMVVRLAYYKRPDRYLLATGWLWFLISLVPMILPPRRGAWVAERFMYSSGIGLLLVIAVIASMVHERPRFQRTITAVFVLWLGTMMLLAKQQVMVWRDSETLLEHNAKAEPWSPHAQGLLGTYYLDQHQLPQAIKCFEVASRLAPWQAEYLNEQGLAMGMLGDLTGSEAVLRKAVEIDPLHPAALNNLSTALREQGKLNEALSLATRAIEIAPTMAEAHLNAAILYERLGNPVEAAKHGKEWQHYSPPQEPKR